MIFNQGSILISGTAYRFRTKPIGPTEHFREAQPGSLTNNLCLIYVKDGEAVLDNVFINDIPIAKYVEH